MDTEAVAAQDALTMNQMTGLMSDDHLRVMRAQEALEKAQRTYNDLTHRSRHASDEAHQIAQRDHLPALEEAERAAERAAEAAERNTREIRRQTEAATMALDAGEAAQAAAVLPLLERDVATLELVELAGIVRASIGRNDRASMYVFARLLPQRLKDGSPGSGRPGEDRARTELLRMASQIRDALRDRSFDAIRTKTDEALERSHNLRSAATKRQREAPTLVDHMGRVKVPFPQLFPNGGVPIPSDR